MMMGEEADGENGEPACCEFTPIEFGSGASSRLDSSC